MNEKLQVLISLEQCFSNVFGPIPPFTQLKQVIK